LAVKRSRKTRKTASKTRKIASKTRRKTRKVKKVKSPAKRKKPTKPSNLKHDTDLGTLTLSQYVNAKRKTKQDEISKYEKQYLSRYKQPKIQKKKTSSDLYKPEIPKPKPDRRKERKEYEQKYLSRYKQPKSAVKKSTSWTQHDVALGRLTLSTHFNAKRKAKQDEISKYEKQYLSRYKEPKPQKRTSSDLYKPEIPKPRRDVRKERKEYEQKYLSRYKQPKSGVKKSTSWTQHDVALGRLTLSPHFNAKRRAKQDEIREYEQKYLSRYKEPKTKKNVGSDLYKPEIPKPKLDMKKERKKYEQKYLSRYKQPKSGVKKSTSWTQHDVALGRLTLSPHFNAKRRAKQDEIREYEKQYLSRYKQPKSGVKKSTSWTQHDVALGRLTLSPHFNAKRRAKQDEIREYEKQYLSRYKEPKTKKNTGSSLYKPEIPKPKIDRRKERKEYEQKYLARHLKQRKTKPKKKK